MMLNRISGGHAVLIIAWVCLGGKMFACLEEGKKRKWKLWTKKCCTLAWISSILCLVLLLCILPSHYHVSFKPSSRPGHGWTSEGFKQDTLPWWRAYGWVLCVFQGSAGALPSGEGESKASICLLGTAGESAGKPVTSSFIWSMCCPHHAHQPHLRQRITI